MPTTDKAVKVVVFTRHQMSDAQWAGMHEEVTNACQCEGWVSNLQLAIMRRRAEERINTDEDATEILKEWLSFDTQAVMVFGVFPPILRRILFLFANPKGGRLVLTYETHNMERAEEGEAPKFEFGGWMLTGRYLIRAADLERI